MSKEVPEVKFGPYITRWQQGIEYLDLECYKDSVIVTMHMGKEKGLLMCGFGGQDLDDLIDTLCAMRDRTNEYNERRVVVEEVVEEIKTVLEKLVE